VDTRSGGCVFGNSPFGGCIGGERWQYEQHCCYSSPVAMGLSTAIKSQLGIPTNSCSGIPLHRFEQVNFNDPRIIAIMEAQVGNVMDDPMFRDLQEKYSKQNFDSKPAEDMGNTINNTINKNKIPGI
jgi:hypothetical protein